MRLVWAQLAHSDRDDIFTHIEAEIRERPFMSTSKIAHTARRLIDFPESGRPCRIDGMRELVVSRAPYIPPMS